MAKKDMKEALSGGRKADITHIRTPLLVYGARACEYGDAKYERANYQRPTDAGLKLDYERMRVYLGACLRHIYATLDEMERHQAEDPDLINEEGMKRAAYAVDTDYKPGQAVGASYLPHLCGAVASLNMVLTQATQCGLLPKDPGRPWEAGAAVVQPYDYDKDDMDPDWDSALARAELAAERDPNHFLNHAQPPKAATTEEEAIAALERHHGVRYKK